MKNLMNKIRKSNVGFTLVELIIVVAIIAVLTAVLAPQYIKYIEKSKVSADQNNSITLLHEVEVAVVDAAANGGTITAGTYTMANTGTTTDYANTTDVYKAVAAADANWSKVKSARTGAEYTITVTVTSGVPSVSGAWNTGHDIP